MFRVVKTNNLENFDSESESLESNHDLLSHRGPLSISQFRR
jgi:hypothetical protein